MHVHYTVGSPFPRHERNPKMSTSEVNLVQKTSVDFTESGIGGSKFSVLVDRVLVISVTLLLLLLFPLH